MKTLFIEQENLKIEVEENLQIVIDPSIRNLNLQMAFSKPKVTAEVLGIFHCKEEPRNIYLESNHLEKNTQNNIHIRNLLEEGADTSIMGKIKIEGEAEEVVSEMTFKGLALAEEISWEVTPLLEVKNNNVETNHITTLQQLNNAELTFIRSRGVSKEEAEKLIIDSFIQGILNQIADDKIKYIVQERLGL